MIDIHCHLLPAVDDGQTQITDCLEAMKQAAADGVTDMILTPHYIKSSKYAVNNFKKCQILQLLEIGKKNHGIKMNLYLGNENYIHKDLANLLDHGEIMSLNGSRYILVELPVNVEDKSAKQTFYDLVTRGYIPVLAHPERYHYIQKNPEKVDEYLELGCLMQGDYQSLFGKYGRKAKKTLKYLIKENRIHFLASDTHKSTDRYNLKLAYKKVARIAQDKSTATRLFEDNPRKVLLNQPF